jgi:hypothetical protein
VPRPNALLADVVPRRFYGRAYAFERLGDNAGAVVGPLLAAAAIVYAIRRAPKLTARTRTRLKIAVRPLLRGPLGRLLAAAAALEVANVAATLLILHATDLLTPVHGLNTATQLALVGYIGFKLAATVATVPAGRLTDRGGAARGGPRVLAAGAALFALAYATFRGCRPAPRRAGRRVPAGRSRHRLRGDRPARRGRRAGPAQLRGLAFGLLATVQAAGGFLASAVAGLLYTVVSTAVAFGYLAAWMLVAAAGLTITARGARALAT